MESPPLYKGKPIKFTCLRCGHCCRTLIKENNGIITGLSLSPSEIKYFPKEGIIPSLGKGKDKNNISKIIRYQLIGNICPNLETNKCKIYENRPLFCKRFPLQSSMYLLAHIADRTDCKFVEQIEIKLKTELRDAFSPSTFEDKGCWEALQTEIHYGKNVAIDAELEGLSLFHFNSKTNNWEKVK